MTITLTAEIESALTASAERQGTTPELLALDGLRSLYVPERPAERPDGRTLADVLAGHLGTIDSSVHMGGQPSHLSEDEGQGFAEHLAEKRHQGRL